MTTLFIPTKSEDQISHEAIMEDSMGENEKLRALLAEAQGWLFTIPWTEDESHKINEVRNRIKAALAEPGAKPKRIDAHDALYRRICEDREFWENYERERDEARAEIARAKTEVTAWKESAEAAERFRKSAIAEAEIEVEVLKALLSDAREGLDTLAVPGSERNLKWLQDVRARIKNSLPEDWNKPDGVEGE